MGHLSKYVHDSGEWFIGEEKKSVKGYLDIPEFSFGELDDLQVFSPFPSAAGYKQVEGKYKGWDDKLYDFWNSA